MQRIFGYAVKVDEDMVESFVSSRRARTRTDASRLPAHDTTRAVTTTDRVERLERRPTVFGIVEEMKIFGDLRDIVVGPWKWEVSDDLVGLDIVQVHIYVTTLGGCSVMLYNATQEWDVLTTPLTIGGGEWNAKTDRITLETIDETKNHLQGNPLQDDNDRLWLDVLSGGGKGLGLIVTYGRDRRP